MPDKNPTTIDERIRKLDAVQAVLDYRESRRGFLCGVHAAAEAISRMAGDNFRSGNDREARALRHLSDEILTCPEVSFSPADLDAEDSAFATRREFTNTGCAIGAWITDETEGKAVAAGLWPGPEKADESNGSTGTSRKLEVIACAADAAAQGLREVDDLAEEVKRG